MEHVLGRAGTSLLIAIRVSFNTAYHGDWIDTPNHYSILNVVSLRHVQDIFQISFNQSQQMFQWLHDSCQSIIQSH